MVVWEVWWKAIWGFVGADWWRFGLICAWVLGMGYVWLWKRKVKKVLGIRGAWKRMHETYKRLFGIGG